MVSDLVKDLLKDVNKDRGLGNRLGPHLLGSETKLSTEQLETAAKTQLLDRDFLEKLSMSKEGIPDALKGDYDPLQAFQVAYQAMSNNLSATISNVLTTIIGEAPGIEPYRPFSPAGLWRTRKDDSADAFEQIILSCETANIETTTAFLGLKQHLRVIAQNLESLRGLPTDLTPQIKQVYEAVTAFDNISQSKEFDKLFTLAARDAAFAEVPRLPGVGGIGGGAVTPVLLLRQLQVARSHSPSLRKLYWRHIAACFDVLLLAVEAVEYYQELGLNTAQEFGVMESTPAARGGLIYRVSRGRLGAPPAPAGTVAGPLVALMSQATDTLVNNTVAILIAMGPAYATNVANAISAMPALPDSTNEATIQARITRINDILQQLQILYGSLT